MFNEAVTNEFNVTAKREMPKLIRVAEAVLRCESAAKDAVQVALVRVWKNIATFDPKKGTLEALLHVSVKRVALDHVISRKRMVAAMERLWGETIVKERPKKADPRMERLMEALSDLPEKKRLLIQKRFFEGKKVLEIAKEIGLSKVATQARLHRIEKSLQRKLLKK